MEKSIDSFVEYLKEEFQLEDQDLRTYSPLTLAYIGDSIFDLVIRTLLVKHGNCPPQKLHERASKLVKASAQAEMIENLMPVLRKSRYTNADAMQSLTQKQKMQRWQITVKRPDWKP